MARASERRKCTSEKGDTWLSDAQFLVGLPRGRSRFALKRNSLRSHLRFVYVRVRFTWLPRGFRFSNGPADDGGSSSTLTPACESGPALPASAIQKKSFLCRHSSSLPRWVPSPAWQHLFPSLVLPAPYAHSRHFPSFSFHFALSFLSLAFLSALPFFRARRYLLV